MWERIKLWLYDGQYPSVNVPLDSPSVLQLKIGWSAEARNLPAHYHTKCIEHKSLIANGRKADIEENQDGRSTIKGPGYTNISLSDGNCDTAREAAEHTS